MPLGNLTSQFFANVYLNELDWFIKSEIIRLGSRLNFLGFRVFYYHRLLKKSNLGKMRVRFKILKEEYNQSKIDYDAIYDFLEGWFAYAKNANTYKLMRSVAAKEIEMCFSSEISTKEINRQAKLL